jgi:formimidoylglutamate deiminase
MTGKTLWATTALLSTGWANNVSVTIGADGRIATVRPDSPAPNSTAGGTRIGILLPAPANLHSHAFQRAFAGMTERRGPPTSGARDSFWSWRQLMYRFLQHLGPDDVESISAYVYMQMLQAGYAAVGEFHYLHHQANGQPYAEVAELSQRIAAAAQQSGIGLCLLPVLYQQGGCDGRALGDAQKRFGNTTDRFATLFSNAGKAVAQLDADSSIGVAPHSLRAVPLDSMNAVAGIAPQAPVHIHVAEQGAEVEEVLQASGQRPVQWLLNNCDINARWCLVHATHMTPAETIALANSGAIAGLCPITEANLGDGIFDGARFLQAGGRFGIGSDSNVRISLAEELRLLEYSQRLQDRARAVFASDTASTGRTLFENAAHGGAQATGREAGKIAAGHFADLLALDAQCTELRGQHGDDLLDCFVFTAAENVVTDVWSAGRHVVQQGQHVQQQSITSRYQTTMANLRSKL